MESVNNYYEKYNLQKNWFSLIFNQIKIQNTWNFDETKVSSIDDPSGIFLKDGAKLWYVAQFGTICTI